MEEDPKSRDRRHRAERLRRKFHKLTPAPPHFKIITPKWLLELAECQKTLDDCEGKQRECFYYGPVESMLTYVSDPNVPKKIIDGRSPFVAASALVFPEWDPVRGAKKEAGQPVRILVEGNMTEYLTFDTERAKAVDHALKMNLHKAGEKSAGEDKKAAIDEKKKENGLWKVLFLVEGKDGKVIVGEKGIKNAYKQAQARLVYITEDDLIKDEEGDFLPVVLISIIGFEFWILYAFYLGDGEWVITELDDAIKKPQLKKENWNRKIYDHQELLAQLFARYMEYLGVQEQDWFTKEKDEPTASGNGEGVDDLLQDINGKLQALLEKLNAGGDGSSTEFSLTDAMKRFEEAKVNLERVGGHLERISSSKNEVVEGVNSNRQVVGEKAAERLAQLRINEPTDSGAERTAEGPA